MTSTIITEGQSLVDVAIQETGTVATLFELADAAGLAITAELVPGAVLAVPTLASAQPAVVAYFAGRRQRINTGAPPAPEQPRLHDFKQIDFSPKDFA